MQKQIVDSLFRLIIGMRFWLFSLLRLIVCRAASHVRDRVLYRTERLVHARKLMKSSVRAVRLLCVTCQLGRKVGSMLRSRRVRFRWTAWKPSDSSSIG